MADKARQKALANAQRAQGKVERAQGQLDNVREERRESFKQARKAGLSLGEIGKAVGLHRSRVDQILNGK
jgi:DNA-directed RNA polymerase specialized sigma24 family protein